MIMEQAATCGYINCNTIEGGKDIFHKLPTHDTNLCVKWLINSGHEDLVGKDHATLESMKISICNNHFSDNAYQSGMILRRDAIPLQHWEVTNNKSSFLKTDDMQQELNTVKIYRIIDTGKPLVECDAKKRDMIVTEAMKSFRKGIFDRIRINQWCRTCATKKTNLVNMIAKDRSSEMDLLTKLKLLIDIDDEDHLSLRMCSECVLKLEQSYRFFQQIYVADNALRQMFPVSKTSSCIAYNSKVNEGVVANVKGNEHSTCLDDINCNSHSEKFVNLRPTNSIKSRSTARLQHTDSKNKNFYTHRGNLSKKYECEAGPSGYASYSGPSKSTVNSLLTETCHSDEELNWVDVLNAMEQQYTSSSMSHASVPKIQIRCEYCNSVFRLRRQLKTHLVVNHFKQIYNICNDCNICYDDKNQLVKHRTIVHNEKKYQCNYCKKMFYRKKNLKLHIENIHFTKLNNKSIDAKYYTCDICDEKYISKQFLESHIHNLHLSVSYVRTIDSQTQNEVAIQDASMYENSLLFPCLVCGRVFCNEEKLDSHIEVHRNRSLAKKKNIRYHCKLCSTSFMLREQLRSHIKSHTIEDWDAYRNKIVHCRECDAQLVGNEKFRIHKMKYHLAKQGDFICLLCDEVDTGLKTLKDYEKHISLHCIQLKRSASHEYKCKYCNDIFVSNSHLLNHLDSFHSDVIRTSPMCHLKVKYKENLKDGVDRVYNTKKEQENVKTEANEKRFLCRVCGKELLTLTERRDHENDHEKPMKELEKVSWKQRYSCNHCDQKFYYIHKLRQHLLDVHGDFENAAAVKPIERNRRYKCSKCQTIFKYKTGLHIHTKSVHSKVIHPCPMCSMKYKFISGLKKHLLTHANNKKFKCDTNTQHIKYNLGTN